MMIAKLAVAALGAAAMQAAVPIAHLSSSLNDYNLSLDANERLLVFARSEADFKNARIFTSERKGKRWSTPQPIRFFGDAHSDSDPWLTPDGKTLYFISDRPAAGRDAARDDYDIWRSVRTAHGWSAPEHLGPEVNSRAHELGPEVHGGLLYFSSARRSGRGGLDIYSARVEGAGFAPAENVGTPFNTQGSESDFTLSPDGKTALFWRMVGEAGVLYMASREGTGWSEPSRLSATVNIGPFNFTPSFSKDGRRIRFASTRSRAGQDDGLADIFEAPLPAR